MIKNTLFTLFSAVSISVLAQAAQSSEGDVVAPATLHQEQTVEGMEALEDTPVQQPSTSQDAAGHPSVASPHQAEVLEEIAMRFRNLDQDQDGQVSQEEAKAEVDLGKQWAALDDNSDGKLNLTEYAKRRRSIKTRSDATMSRFWHE